MSSDDEIGYYDSSGDEGIYSLFDLFEAETSNDSESEADDHEEEENEENEVILSNVNTLFGLDEEICDITVITHQPKDDNVIKMPLS